MKQKLMTLVSLVQKGMYAFLIGILAVVLIVFTMIVSALLAVFPYIAFTKMDDTFGWIHVMISVIILISFFLYNVIVEEEEILSSYITSCIVTFILNGFVFIVLTWFAYEYGMWVGLGTLAFFIIPFMFHDS